MHELVMTTARGEPKTLPLTWGQRWWWNELQPENPDRKRGNILVSNDIPSGLSLGDVRTVIERIFERFEILRTRYGLHDEYGPVQIVERETNTPIFLYADTGSDSGPPDDLHSSMQEYNFKFLDHPPACIAVGLDTGGNAVRLHAFLDHIITDAIGAATLRRHIESDLAESTVTESVIHQSADQVALENTPDRQRLSARAIEYWRSRLSHAPPPGDWLHRLSEARRDPNLDFVRVSLTSKFLTSAVPTIARRHNVGTTSVLCHFASLAFRHSIDLPPVFNMVVSTRHSSAERSALGMYSRSIPLVITAHQRNTDGSIRDTAETIMRGRLFAACDPNEFDGICRALSWPDRAMIGISINDVYSALDESSNRRTLEHRDDLNALLKASHYEQSAFQVYRNAHALKFDFRRDSSDTLRLSVEVDTRIFSAKDAQSLLEEIERAVFVHLSSGH